MARFDDARIDETAAIAEQLFPNDPSPQILPSREGRIDYTGSWDDVIAKLEAVFPTQLNHETESRAAA